MLSTYGIFSITERFISEHIKVILAFGNEFLSLRNAGMSKIASPIAASLIKRIFWMSSMGKRLFRRVNRAKSSTKGIPKYLSKNRKIFFLRIRSGKIIKYLYYYNSAIYIYVPKQKNNNSAIFDQVNDEIH